MNNPQQQLPPIIDVLRWMPIVNTESVAIPPYAMIEMKGGNANSGFLVGKPSQNSATAGIMVNGPGSVPAVVGGVGGVGHGLFINTQVIAAYETSGSGLAPAALQNWGTVAGSWFLNSLQNGFQIARNGAGGIVDIIPAPSITNQMPCCPPTGTGTGVGPQTGGNPTGGGPTLTGGGPILPPPPMQGGNGGQIYGWGFNGNGSGGYITGGGPAPGGCGPNQHTVLLNNGQIACAPGAVGTSPGGATANNPGGFANQGSLSPYGGAGRPQPSKGLNGRFLGDEGAGINAGPWMILMSMGLFSGTAGQVYTSNGAGLLGSFQAASSGMGVVAHTDTLGATASLSTFVTYTDSGSGGIYLVTCNGVITSATGTNLTVTVAWTDRSGNPQSQNLFLPGTTSAAIATTGAISFPPFAIYAQASSVITLKTSVVGLSIAYDIYGTIQKIR
jgi:hypothetical protein